MTTWGAGMTTWGGGRPAWVRHAPPRVPTGDTPTVVLVSGGTPVGITGPAGPRLGTSAGARGSPSPQSSPNKGEEEAMFFLVGQEEDAGDPAGGFGEVLDFVRLEGPAEDGALAVGEPLL